MRMCDIRKWQTQTAKRCFGCQRLNFFLQNFKNTVTHVHGVYLNISGVFLIKIYPNVTKENLPALKKQEQTNTNKVHPAFINAYLICIGQLLCINTIKTMVVSVSTHFFFFSYSNVWQRQLSCVLLGKGMQLSFSSAYDTSVQSQYFCLYRSLCIFHNYLLNFTYFKIYINLYFIL